MREDFVERSLRGQAVEFLEYVGLAVLDEFVGPADALDVGGNTRVVKMLNTGRSEAICQDVILEGADDFAGACNLFE